MPTTRKRITFYPTPRVLTWWESQDSNTGTQLLNKACEFLLTRYAEILLSDSFPEEETLVPYNDKVWRCSMHRESSRAIKTIITPLDSTIEADCGCIFRRFGQDRRWRRLVTGNGVDTQIYREEPMFTTVSVSAITEINGAPIENASNREKADHMIKKVQRSLNKLHCPIHTSTPTVKSVGRTNAESADLIVEVCCGKLRYLIDESIAHGL